MNGTLIQPQKLVRFADSTEDDGDFSSESLLNGICKPSTWLQLEQVVSLKRRGPMRLNVQDIH